LRGKVDLVYVATSQLGFEALMLNKPVTCFGMPFYAGWGLTDDRVAIARRTHRRTRHEVFAAAYLRYARYVDPRTGRRGTLEDLIAHIVESRTASSRAPGAALGVALGAP
jgi:capsular polysaccharide export protein